MVDRPFPTFKFANLANYNGPFEGQELWPFIGPAKCRVISGTKVFAKTAPHNPSIEWKLQGEDQDCEGMTITTTKAYSGVDVKGEPLERQTADIILSAGVAVLDTIKQYAAQNIEVGPDEIIAMLQGQVVIADIGRFTSNKDGVTQFSSVDNFITPEMYEEKKKTPGAFRRTPPAVAKMAGGGARAPGAAQAPIGGNIGGAVRPGVAVPGAPAAPTGFGGFAQPGAAPGGFAQPAQAGFAQPGFAQPAQAGFAQPAQAGTPAALGAAPAQRVGSPTLQLPTLPGARA